MPTTPKVGARRERMIGVHVTPEEYEELRRMAFEARTSIPALIRERFFAPKKKAK